MMNINEVMIKTKILDFLDKCGVKAILLFYKNRVFPSKWVKTELILKKKWRVFYAQFIKSGDLCFDIGANIGNRSEVFLDLGGRVIAVEPQEFCCQYLKLKFGKEIQIVQKGVGSSKGVALLYISNSSPLSSFSKDWIDKVKETVFKDKIWGKTKEVELTTLDDLIKKYGVPKFCKIDVEGYEYEVLKGLKQSIQYISFEFSVPDRTDEAILCLEYLNKLSKIKCNYSLEESMEWGLEEWIESDKMISFLDSNKLGDTGGDIYVEMRNNT